MRPSRRILLVAAATTQLMVPVTLPWSSAAYGQVPDARGVCQNCPAGGTGPSGPSEEELRRKRAARVLSRQAEDAYDDGVVSLKRGDYAKAVKYFAEALEYAPDDPVIEGQLKKARWQALARCPGEEHRVPQQPGNRSSERRREQGSVEGVRYWRTE